MINLSKTQDCTLLSLLCQAIYSILLFFKIFEKYFLLRYIVYRLIYNIFKYIEYFFIICFFLKIKISNITESGETLQGSILSK